MKIPITRPWFDDDELSAVLAPIKSGWVVQGPQVAAFEAAFADYVGVAHAVACTSATTALHLALAAHGIGPGDEVLVPSFTWVATANAARYCGATPVLCDIELATFNLDLADAERRITAATRAIVPVHLFGLPADLDGVRALAAQHDLVVVEDAACALGARWGDAHVGTAALGAFSFHPRKAITTGEGGMLTTDDLEVAERLRVLRNHGGSAPLGPPGPHQMGDHDVLGFNYRMTDLQGALGVAQMRKVPEIQRRRAALAARYDAELGDLGWLRTPQRDPRSTHGWQSYVCLYAPEAPGLAAVDRLGEARNAMMVELERRGVSTRPGTHAVHALGTYCFAPESRPQAWLADRLSFALPLYPTMSEDEQSYVIEQLRAI